MVRVDLLAWNESGLALLQAMNTPEQKIHLGGPESDAKTLDRHKRYLTYHHPGEDEMLMISVDGVPGIYRAMLAGEASLSVEVKPDIGKYIFDVVQGYLRGKRDYPKWVLIPTDLHSPEDAAKMLQRHGGA